MQGLKFELNFADYFVIVIYAVLVIYLGFRASLNKKDESRESFLLAGRKLTLPLFVASLVSTWYGNILGVGEFVYGNGLVAWACFGLPYYIAGAAFALLIAKKVRNSNVHTIPEQIEKRYGVFAGKIASLMVLLISIPAAYILMIGIIIQMISGFSLLISIIIGAVLSSAYLFKGGLKSDVMANTAQFVLMFVGFSVLLVFSLNSDLSLQDAIAIVPSGHMKLFGNFSWQIVISWYLIALQTFVDPSFHQRCSAARDGKTAQKGILISIVFWAMFDFLTLTTGLYARAMFSNIQAVYAYPVLSNAILPHFWKGLFIVSMLSPIMAAFDGYSFISAATIGNDILSPLFKKFKFADNIRLLTNIGLVFSVALAVVLALILPSAIQLIYKTASIAVPALLIPIMLSFSRRMKISSFSVIFIMLLSGGTSLGWTLLRIYSDGSGGGFMQIVNLIEPMIAGIVVSAIVSIFVIMSGKKQHVDNI